MYLPPEYLSFLYDNSLVIIALVLAHLAVVATIANYMPENLLATVMFSFTFYASIIAFFVETVLLFLFVSYPAYFGITPQFFVNMCVIYICTAFTFYTCNLIVCFNSIKNKEISSLLFVVSFIFNLIYPLLISKYCFFITVINNYFGPLKLPFNL